MTLTTMTMTPTEAARWRQQLKHVRWLGGPPDAGKSTVTLLLESMHGVHIYRQDGHEMEHIRRADPARFPRNAAMREQLERDEEGFWEQWVAHAPAVQAENAAATWIERLPLICDDLAAMDDTRLIIAEGPGFFPDAIRPLLSDPHQAAWLIPTEQFKRDSHARRGKSAWRDRTSDPNLALHNHIERDLIMTGFYRSELCEGDFAIEVDGTVPPEAIAERLATWYGIAA